LSAGLLRVFISSSPRDVFAEHLARRLSGAAEVLSHASIEAGAVWTDAAEGLVEQSDLVIVALPAGRSNMNFLMFEAGLARGMDKPMLVVSDERLPRTLSGFSVISRQAASTLPAADLLHLLKNIVRDSKNAVTGSHKRFIQRRLKESDVEQEVLSASRVDEDAIIGTLYKFFASENAKIVSPRRDEKGHVGADLVVWDDELTSLIAQPMLIRVDVASKRKVSMIALRDSLKGAGASTLLQLTNRREALLFRQFEEGAVFIINVDDFIEDVSHAGMLASFARYIDLSRISK
jgi:hypothetical protein